MLLSVFGSLKVVLNMNPGVVLIVETDTDAGTSDSVLISSTPESFQYK